MRDAGGGCNTLLRNSRLREQPPAAIPAPPLRAPCHGGSHSTMPRSATPRAPVVVATLKGIGFAGGLRCAAATRYCAAADCGSSRLQLPPAPDAYAHRVGSAAPSEGNDHSRQPSPQSSPARGRGGDRPFPRLRGKSERGLAFLSYSPADTLPRSGRLREAGQSAAFPRQRLTPTVSCRLSRKAECAAMRDLIRGSLVFAVYFHSTKLALLSVSSHLWHPAYLNVIALRIFLSLF